MSKPATGSRRRLVAAGGVLLAVMALTAAWQWSPLRDWLTPERLVAMLSRTGAAVGPWAAVPLLALALCLAVPLGLLILVSQLALGPWTGSLCIVAGAVSSAAISHAIGRGLGHELLLRLKGPRLLRLSEKLEHQGLLAVIALRLVPVAPFAIVNMVAGSTHLRRRDMVLGTALGMLPGTLLIALFTDQLLDALRQPGPQRYWLVGGTAALVALGALLARRWMVSGKR